MTAVLPLPERDEWTVDDLAGLSDDYRYELINGRLVVTSPLLPHQDLAIEILIALRANRPPDAAPGHEVSVLVDQRSQPRPDVVAVRLDHTDRIPIPVQDVLLVVEILSKNNTLKDIQEKQRLYARAEVPHYWVVNPLRGPITLTELEFDPERRRYEPRSVATGGFETDRPWPVRLDLPALTAQYRSLLPRERSEAAR